MNTNQLNGLALQYVAKAPADLLPKLKDSADNRMVWFAGFTAAYADQFGEATAQLLALYILDRHGVISHRLNKFTAEIYGLLARRIVSHRVHAQPLTPAQVAAYLANINPAPVMPAVAPTVITFEQYASSPYTHKSQLQLEDDGQPLDNIYLPSHQAAFIVLQAVSFGEIAPRAITAKIRADLLKNRYIAPNPIEDQHATHILTGRGFRWAFRLANTFADEESAYYLSQALTSAWREVNAATPIPYPAVLVEHGVDEIPANAELSRAMHKYPLLVEQIKRGRITSSNAHLMLSFLNEDGFNAFWEARANLNAGVNQFPSGETLALARELGLAEPDSNRFTFNGFRYFYILTLF